MWTALGVALVATIMGVITFLSRGKALKKVGKLEAQVDEADKLIESLLEEIEALALGDHGLDHADMEFVLRPNLRDDSRDDS